jgi:hypothetical protein
MVFKLGNHKICNIIVVIMDNRKVFSDKCYKYISEKNDGNDYDKLIYSSMPRGLFNGLKG